MRKTILYRDGLIFLVITSVLFIGAAAREVNLLLLFASLLASLLFLDRIFGRRSLRKLTAHRTLPPVIHAGDSFLVTIKLENERRKGGAWSILVEDAIFPDFTIYADFSFMKIPRKETCFQPACYFEEIRPGESIRKTYAGRLPLRGRYEFRDLVISTRFPLGFFRSLLPQEDPQSITVYPRIGRLTRQWFRRFSSLAEEKNRSRHLISRTSDELFGVRSWQSGDVRKWIHWRASAKHDKIFVRQFEERKNMDVAIVLDLYESGKRPTPDSFENGELGISFAATLIREYSRNISGTFYFGADFSNEKDEINPDQSPLIMEGKISLAFIRGMMERLSIIRFPKKDRLSDILRELLGSVSGNTNIILITTRPLNLFNSERFVDLRKDVRFVRSLGQMIVVDTSSSEFDSFFQING